MYPDRPARLLRARTEAEADELIALARHRPQRGIEERGRGREPVAPPFGIAVGDRGERFSESREQRLRVAGMLEPDDLTRISVIRPAQN